MADDSPETPARGTSAFVIGCVLGLVFIGGGLLVAVVAGGFAWVYMAPRTQETVATLSLQNPSARDVSVKCVGNGQDVVVEVSPGETEVIALPGLPVNCAGRVDDEEVWSWSAEEGAEEGTAWTESLPMLADPAALFAEPTPEPVVEAAVDPLLAPAGVEAVPPTAPSASPPPTTTPTTPKTATSKPKTTTTTAPVAAEPEPVAAPAPTTTTTTTTTAAKTKVTVDYAKKAKKVKGVTVTVDGKSIGGLPSSTEVGVGMHTVSIAGGGLSKSCSLAASGAAWTWLVDPEALACP